MQREDFISIIIPSFNRFNYLEDVVNSIHNECNYPFELIVHDDASSANVQEEIYNKLMDKISTLIIHTNRGWNYGLSASADRAVSLCNSKYVLFINADCKIVRPFFKEIVDILKKDFVGFITPMESASSDKYFINNNTKYVLSYGVGGGAVIAFRKSVWDEVNGFGDMWSGGADTHFLDKIWRAGYFRASILGDNPIYNISFSEKGNRDTTINGSVNDCSLPKLFGYGKIKYEQESKKRFTEIDHIQHQNEKIDRGETNTNYWHNLTSSFINFPYFDWEIAVNNGFGKFKDEIINEKIYG